MKTPEKWIIGIDEVGRGPLAGPVSVGVFMTDKKTGNWILKNIFENKLRDSKKLSAKKREKNYKKFLELKKLNKISFSVSHISNKIIDKKGISKAIQTGVKKSLKELHHTFLMKKGNPSFIRLDGLLKAPKEFKNQKTIIKGDEKDVFIACASIVAKVSRDNLMCKLALKYPQYNFETHKGYGTLLHRHLIKKLGLSEIHRKSFCKI
ncbi:MAG: Ribonuclease HII [Parcubacteria group bacterium GW2011_GWC1_34_10]|uniref:Ribonuclease n=1 Tax=Candidatus Zambryskibacteria bacterium RIFCSPLOWO2_01_FULL_35_19 TaxID=1802757 RepID=A0A1G2TUY2_9BACT|nr:MAG: Ribonuclease HII [Parcubacteria group bacterium GW2011_GWC1_34_10]OHA85981.1 MAG: hypothetical protein A2726_01200 [Candidatus Zambryskibacteria bacterium RIFCSPHIGHO2_01_FULL_35_32]OHB01145.1 MAG: hypothetical protein A3A90_02790 [Candidatus Zambryskibacteria bacterium RIFCSPLOWO2_01_FULL_35_19]